MDEGEETAPIYQVPRPAGRPGAIVVGQTTSADRPVVGQTAPGQPRTRVINNSSHDDLDDLDDVRLDSDSEPDVLDDAMKAVPKDIVKALNNLGRDAPLPPNNLVQNSAMFWSIIKNMFWRDRSDCVIDITRTKAQLGSNMSFVKSMYSVFANPLKTKLQANAEFANNNLSDAEVDKVVSHIIASGESTYKAIFDEPSICLYLIPGEYQDFTRALN
jgi:hypothetical protein